MVKSNTKKLQHIDFCILFLITCLPRLILALTGKMGFWPSDEVATLSGAASLAGYDWSAVISQAGYYGQGFYSLFAPVFMLTDNPFTIYRVIAVVCALLQGSIAFFAYHIARKYFQVRERKILLFISVACSYMLNTEAVILYNEHPIILVCWLIVLLLLQLHACMDKKWAKALYTILLMLVMGYAITLHTRSWTLWLALLGTVILYYLIYRRSLISLPVCIGAGSCLAIGLGIVISRIQSSLWLHNGSEPLRNAGIYFSEIPLNTPDGFHAWLNIIIGQIHSASFASLGASVLCIVIFLSLIMRALRHKEILPDRNHHREQQFIILGTYFLTAVIVTIGGLSLTWLSNATKALQEGFGNTHTSLKIFLYFRYFAPYTGPLLLLLFVYFYHYPYVLKRYLKPATLLFGGLQIFWLASIVPYVYQFQEYKAVRFCPYVLFAFGDRVNLATFIIAALVLTVAWSVMWTFLRKGRIYVPIAMITIFLVYHYMSMSIGYVQPRQDFRYQKINGGYEFIQELEANHIAFPTIYAPAQMNNTTAPFYYYQFYLNRYTIIPEYPDETCQTALVLYSQPNNAKLLSMGYRYTKLDSNEYLYCNSKEFRKIIKQFGYRFKG